jgi:hypothetical protein
MRTIEDTTISGSRAGILLAMDTVIDALSQGDPMTEGSSLITGTIVTAAIQLSNEIAAMAVPYETRILLIKVISAIGGESAEQFNMQLKKGFFNKDLARFAHFIQAQQVKLSSEQRPDRVIALERFLALIDGTLKTAQTPVMPHPRVEPAAKEQTTNPFNLSVLVDAGNIAADIKKLINTFGRKGTNQELFDSATHDLEKAKLGFWILQIVQVVKIGPSEKPEWLGAALNKLGLVELVEFSKRYSEGAFINEIREFNKLFSAQRGYYAFVAKTLLDSQAPLSEDQQNLKTSSITALGFSPPNEQDAFVAAYSSGKFNADIEDCQRLMNVWLIQGGQEPLLPETALRHTALTQVAEMISAAPVPTSQSSHEAP